MYFSTTVVLVFFLLSYISCVGYSLYQDDQYRKDFPLDESHWFDILIIGPYVNMREFYSDIMTYFVIGIRLIVDKGFRSNYQHTKSDSEE